MRVTKYPQSCLVIEENGKRIAIDPGSFVSQKYKAEDLLPLDGILITHEHQDHADPEFIKSLVSKNSIPVVGNKSTSAALGDVVTKIIEEGEKFEVAGFKITARELPHVDMVDGSPGPQNTGFVINDVFFHPGDGIAIDNLSVEKVAVPIAGPDISPKDVASFIKQIGCKIVIPIHYDAFPADPHFYARILSNINGEIKVIVLDNGQSEEV